VLAVALWEAGLLGGLGLLLGLMLGHGVAFGVGTRVSQQSALAVQVGLERAEVPIVLLMFVLGIGAGLLPALRAYRIETTQVLAGLP
jgi:putative ABC transport system permease protein